MVGSRQGPEGQAWRAGHQKGRQRASPGPGRRHEGPGRTDPGALPSW